MRVNSQSFCAIPLQDGDTVAEQLPLSRPTDQKASKATEFGLAKA